MNKTLRMVYIYADATLDYVAQSQKGRLLTETELKRLSGRNLSLNVVEVYDDDESNDAVVIEQSLETVDTPETLCPPGTETFTKKMRMNKLFRMELECWQRAHHFQSDASPTCQQAKSKNRSLS